MTKEKPVQITQARKLPPKREGDEWTAVSSFGEGGVILARGNERKIVTPNFKDFDYPFKPIRTR